MDKPYRRYEILLPLRFNDGSSVGDDLIAETLIELESQFGAVSCESQNIRGSWSHEGQRFRDDLVRVFVDVVDGEQHRQFFHAYKETLKARFDQLDIWMTTYSIDVI